MFVLPGKQVRFAIDSSLHYYKICDEYGDPILFLGELLPLFVQPHTTVLPASSTTGTVQRSHPESMDSEIKASYLHLKLIVVPQSLHSSRMLLTSWGGQTGREHSAIVRFYQQKHIEIITALRLDTLFCILFLFLHGSVPTLDDF
jgi:hypothetical protein